MTTHPLAATILEKLRGACEETQKKYLANSYETLEYPVSGKERIQDPLEFLTYEELRVFGASWYLDSRSNDHYTNTCSMTTSGTGQKRQIIIKLAPSHATALCKNRTRIEDLTPAQISQLFPPPKVHQLLFTFLLLHCEYVCHSILYS